MKTSVTSPSDRSKKTGTQEYLTSWKEIATYMRSGVRTVQRYESEFGLPVRRPTGKSRGSVIATRAEIDAWIAAAPIRETFKLSRVVQDSRAQVNADKIEEGINAMRKLKDQMLALRTETRSALNVLLERVSAFRSLLPPSRPNGYQPLINMGMDMDKRLHVDGSRSVAKLNLTHPVSQHKGGGRQRNKTALVTTQKPH